MSAQPPDALPFEHLPHPYVITLETQPENVNTQRYLRTLDAQGWPYVLVGQGHAGRMDMADKVRIVLEGLQQILNEKGASARDDLVVFTDARDVLCTRGPRDFREAYWEEGAPPLLVSMEMFCSNRRYWCPPDAANAFHLGAACLDAYWAAVGGMPNGDSREPGSEHAARGGTLRKFVNSGLIAGRLGALVDCLQWCVTEGKRLVPTYCNDQRLIGE